MRWIIDEEGDIGLSLFDVVVFIKYKYSVIIEWWVSYEDAPKYI